MKALVVGASGQLGAALVARLGSQGWQSVGTHCSRPAAGSVALDLRDHGQVQERLAAAAVDLIFLSQNTPGGVDYCEGHPAEADTVLVQGTRHVLEAAATRRTPVVFYSSDYVFDGRSGPYAEEAPPCPISAYGRAKLAAERLVQAYPHGSLVIRTTAVFSWAPGTKNFAMQIFEDLRAGRRFKAPDDQWCSPTLAEYLAEASLRLFESGARGIFNVVGHAWMPRCDLAVALARAMALDPSLIQPVPTSGLTQRALRPLKGGLKTDKLRQTLGEEPPDLTEFLARFSEKFRQAAPTGPTGAPHA